VAIAKITANKGDGMKFAEQFSDKFMGKLNENEDVRIKVLELLGRKK
jgi:hypothetical protein